jgi:hypothetical protein
MFYLVILMVFLPKTLIAQTLDSDGDGTPDVSDVYPFNPFKDTDDWGQKVDGYPEVFTSADISELNREGLVENINLAANYFGRYEWEWWAVGQDIDAMLGLADAWCNRRIERGQLFYFEGERTNLGRLKSICLTQTAHPHASLKWKNETSFCCLTSDYSTYQGWMEGYREISLNTPSSSANAGMVRNLGYTATQASWPFKFDPATNRVDDFIFTEHGNAVLAFHEYYHVVQAQHVFSKREIVDETNNTVRPEYGPTAFSEGSANYISEFTVRKLSQYGIYQGSVIDLPLKELMRGQMNDIQSMLPNCPNFKIEKLNYGNACDPYTFGMWATAYLTEKVGNIDAFHEVFWPKINALTYVGAFEDTFGLNYDQFNGEFQTFLTLPIKEQLSIIPNVNFVTETSIKRSAAVFSDNTLSIPSVIIEDQGYVLDLKLIENTASGVVFQFLSADGIELPSLPDVPSSIYYSKVGLLDIPDVQIGSESYSISLQLNNLSDLRFKLLAATKNEQ